MKNGVRLDRAHVAPRNVIRGYDEGSSAVAAHAAGAARALGDDAAVGTSQAAYGVAFSPLT